MSTPVIQTDAGREGWEAIVADPATAVISTDFDGVLAPLVEDPAMSRPVEGSLDALARLARSVQAGGDRHRPSGARGHRAHRRDGPSRPRGPRRTGALRAGAVGRGDRDGDQ